MDLWIKAVPLLPELWEGERNVRTSGVCRQPEQHTQPLRVLFFPRGAGVVGGWTFSTQEVGCEAWNAAGALPV